MLSSISFVVLKGLSYTALQLSPGTIQAAHGSKKMVAKAVIYMPTKIRSLQAAHDSMRVYTFAGKPQQIQTIIPKYTPQGHW